MKRTVLFLALVLAASVVFAQKGKVTTAQSYKESGKLDKALEAINLTIDESNPKSAKSITWPKTWEVRGNIYRAIAASKDENFKKLATAPLVTALESYKKALELDVKGRYSKGVKIQLTLLINEFTNSAIGAFEEKDFDKATVAFEKILEIENLPIIKADNAAMDTIIIYNAGLAAYNAKNWDKAIKYYREVAEVGFNGAKIYQLLVDCYVNKGDTVQQEKTLQEGFLKYPDDSNLLFAMINYYLLTKSDSNKAIDYLDMAIEKDPTNASIYFAKGTLTEKLEKLDEAIALYEKAVELNPEYFDAYYNIGAVYHNKGVKILDDAGQIPTSEYDKYEKEQQKAFAEFKKAIPYLEKAISVDDSNKDTMETLKMLYYRLNMMDKYNEMIEKIKKAE